MKEILERSSCRAFKDFPVTEEQLDAILRAAMQAPSMGNQQPWEFITVQDKKKLADLSDIDTYAKFIKTTPQLVVLVCNEDSLNFPYTWEQDCAAAAENMLIEAKHQGLGGYWYGLAGKPAREAFIREQFSLPESIKPFALLGFGKMNRYQKPEDRYDEKKVHKEIW